MPSVRIFIIVVSSLLLAIIAIYLIHSIYLLRTSLSANSTLIATKYDELLSNYTNLMAKYVALQQELNECSANLQSLKQQGIPRHSEVMIENLAINTSLDVTRCNGYTMQGIKEVTLETSGPGYLLITYRLSNPQVIAGQVSYYVYLMAQALPSIPVTAAYTYESTTYAYAAGQYGQLVVPVLPNATYSINLGFVCYVATYYPPTNAGSIINGEIPEDAVVNVTYVWWG